MLEHAVLMNAGLVCERVFADDGLVARNGRADDIGKQSRSGIQQRRVHAGIQVIAVGARAQRHHDFLERGVAGAFADTRDRTFDLARARSERSQTVGDAEPEIVVTVRAEHCVFDPAHFALEPREQRADLIRRRIAHRIRDIDRGCARFDHGRQRLDQEFRFGADCVFGGKFHIVTKFPRAAHGIEAGLQYLLAAHVEFVPTMDRTGREKNVDARVLRLFRRPRNRFDIAELRARQAANDRPAHFRCNRAYRIEVAIGRLRETGFDHVDTKLGERLSDAQFLRAAHREAGRLLAVTQGGVEHAHAFACWRRCQLRVGLMLGLICWGLFHKSACRGLWASDENSFQPHGHSLCPIPKIAPAFPGYRPSMDIKKPRIRFRVRGFWNLRLVLLRRALTRTSVGNEKYEYEYENRYSARIH